MEIVVGNKVDLGRLQTIRRMWRFSKQFSHSLCFFTLSALVAMYSSRLDAPFGLIQCSQTLVCSTWFISRFNVCLWIKHKLRDNEEEELILCEKPKPLTKRKSHRNQCAMFVQGRSMAQPEDLYWGRGWKIEDVSGYVILGWEWGEEAKQRILRVRHGSELKH